MNRYGDDKCWALIRLLVIAPGVKDPEYANYGDQGRKGLGVW